MLKYVNNRKILILVTGMKFTGKTGVKSQFDFNLTES